MVIRRSQTRTIREVIQDFLKENNLTQGLQEQEITRLWYETTGKMVSRHTRSISIKNRKMIVTVDSSVVRNEVMMIRDGLLQELNSHFPDPVIDELVIR